MGMYVREWGSMNVCGMYVCVGGVCTVCVWGCTICLWGFMYVCGVSVLLVEPKQPKEPKHSIFGIF